MKVSKRAQEVPVSATIAVTSRAKEMKAAGVDVVGFGAGEPDLEVFNIGSAKPVALQDLIELLGRLVGVTPIISRMPQPAVDVSRTCASIEKVSSVLGYAPQVALEDGLARFIEWHEVTHGH